MQRSDVRYLVGLSQLPGIGPARLVRLIERFKEPERAWKASETELTQVGIDAKQMPALLQRRREVNLEREMERLDRLANRLDRASRCIPVLPREESMEARDITQSRRRPDDRWH